ncbi:protein kinase family protein [Paenibacillus sp. D9]|uniref:protein kinase family protein n=1 Tax=Paenibacillus sp. D9 TaxID=665792 RepID=UPI0006762AB4|nr:protein kinase family protein [Paenibacillus sp. D9]
MLKTGAIVEFNRKKHFKYISPLGSGGTGDAHLFEDDVTDMLFAFKKYSPKGSNYIEENYDRFVDEIKILFKISHPNVVRVYNYYLYPDKKLGYLQMEYINGIPIDQFVPLWGKYWDDIFTEVISAFMYLEANKILHRDIRAANILIDNEENVKVIDFGFGKKLEPTEQDGRSVFLNWPVSQLPNETAIEGIYNHKTEIYFIGKLFQNILGDELGQFKFRHIIEKMIKVNPEERFQSFNIVSQEISKGVLGEIDFSEKDKGIYQRFAEALCWRITSYIDKYEPINDTGTTLSRLSAVIRSSSLEEHVQDNSQLIRCFIKGAYTYKNKVDIEVVYVIEFYQLLQSLSQNKQKIVFDNIYTRLAKIKVVTEEDDLPF